MANEGTALLTTNNPVKLSNKQQVKKRYPFYDPTTHKWMNDPVVAPGGISYERSSWEAKCERDAVPSAPAYDNRALKQIMEETLLDEDSNNNTIVKKVQHRVQKGITGLVEKSILPSDDHKPLSDAYYCPITMCLMRHPVIGPEGYSFERDAIATWVQAKQVSPLTRAPLPSPDLLYPNLALQEMLKLELEKMNEADVSVRDFKLSLDEEKQEYHEYSGPRTMEEWQELRNTRRHANAEINWQGVWFLVVLVTILVLIAAFYIVMTVLFGWYFIFSCVALDCCCRRVAQTLVAVSEQIEAEQQAVITMDAPSNEEDEFPPLPTTIG